MKNQTTEDVIKCLIQRLDLNFISYVESQPDKTVSCPEEFTLGYHKCIEDLINEAQRISYATTATTTPSDRNVRES